MVLFGARTGGDGIGGASVLASATFEADGPRKRPSVQVGDPFAEKVLIECCLEIFAEDLVRRHRRILCSRLSCATSELASAGTGGMRVVLDTVPLRDPTLAPEEILMSESQERMCAVVEPGKVAQFLEICAKSDINATVMAEVTDTQAPRDLLARRAGRRRPAPERLRTRGRYYDPPIDRPADLEAP